MSPRRRLLLVAVLTAVAVLGAVGVVRLISGRTSAAAPGTVADQGRPGTVLLVPGYGGGQVGMSRLAERLRAQGRTATVVTLPGDGTGDLGVQADVLQRAVDRALGDGAPSVDIIGYSAGGVVARLWLDRHDGARSARRIVSLGSPLHGARIAAAGAAVGPDACPPACQQLAPGSDLVARLDRSPLPAGFPWVSIWTENDETVQPPESSRLAGAVNVPVQSLCPDLRLSHGQLPTDPLVTALVLRALAAGPFTLPADCAAAGS